MSDETSNENTPIDGEGADAPSPGNGNAGVGPPSGVVIQTLAQYIKDLSFENPNGATIAREEHEAPDVEMNISVATEKIAEDNYEVALIMHAEAVTEGRTLFMVELTYCGLFNLINVPAERVDLVLKVHCPTLLFPFARHVIADATRHGGYPPLLINSIDFGSIYQKAVAAPGNVEEAPEDK
ncbi:MAG: protein-export chaperone SecB [Proteobacteria bacterium]|nr:protein-export chaperone SecB [Pseudomonadota bacterium]